MTDQELQEQNALLIALLNRNSELLNVRKALGAVSEENRKLQPAPMAPVTEG